MRLDDASPPALDNPESILRLAAASFFEHLSEMSEGILVVDREARIVWISDRYERYLPHLGYKRPEDVIGQPVEQVVPNTLMRRVVETGKPILLDIIDGQQRSFVVSRFPLRDADGAVIGAVGLILYDHIAALKPILGRLGSLQRDLDEARRQLASQRRTRYSFANFVGNGPQAIEVKSRARRAAALNSTVLLIGETGTGKELIAQAIHAASARAARPFVAVNVAAIPESLLEAEFFGVAPGAYTGADRRPRDGKLKLADGGTLLLDEIGDMPLAMQAKLLRVLQEQELEPLGSNTMIRVDLRVIAATSRDLKTLVERGQFRADLFYRLNVVPIRIPPLRERAEDLPALVEHLLERIAEENGRPAKELTAEAIEALQRQPWPGNVRELCNLLEQACAMTDRVRLTLADFAALVPAIADSAFGTRDERIVAEGAPTTAQAPLDRYAPIGAPDTDPVAQPIADPIANSASGSLQAPPTRSPAPSPATAHEPAPAEPLRLAERIARLEREAIVSALAHTRGNRRDAARLLGISRATFYQRLRTYGIATANA